jgi:ubiquinone/menaquinone biosynthesis C-methylase UbiE
VVKVDEGGVAKGFTRTAADYDEAVRFNIAGARRLVRSLPPGVYDEILDVGCGTGFASLEMADNLGTRRIDGVDPAAGMLEQFRGKLAERPGVEVRLHEADVLAMPVPDAAFDAVICSMAFHWFPQKQAAMDAMARTLRPGGVIGILCSGRGGEGEFRAVLAGLEPPVPNWLGAFDVVQRDIPEMERYLSGAGLTALDVWMERRIRRVPPERFLERMRVVAGHLHKDLSPEELEDLNARVAEGLARACGPRGFEYTFTKLFAIARRPEEST